MEQLRDICGDEMAVKAEDIRNNAYIGDESDLWYFIDELCEYKKVYEKINKARSSKQLQKIMRPYLDKQGMKDIFSNGWLR